MNLSHCPVRILGANEDWSSRLREVMFQSSASNGATTDRPAIQSKNWCNFVGTTQRKCTLKKISVDLDPRTSTLARAKEGDDLESRTSRRIGRLVTGRF
jgi:hypothetical protein